MSDGLGYRTLTPGQSLNVNYTDTGRKEWKFRLTLTGGTNLYSHASMLIKTDPYNNYSGQLRMGPTDPETLPFTSTQTYLGLAAQGWITIDYANADRVLRRPLIVAEGFDAGHITHPERWWGSQNIGGFITDLTNDGITTLRNLLIDNPQYDIIYVDWRIGTDYIQRNALLLEDIIRWVNINKEPFNGVMQPLVIIGQSMGGLITRWALKDMENHSENHQTRLFISYDSPQQGANVPLGYQYMARHARSLYIRTGIAPLIEIVQLIRNRVSPFRALSISNTPAARQMLISWVNNLNQVDNSFHNQWQTEIKNLGYPNQYGIRIVAVSNGSECAVTQPYAPGALLLNYSGKANTRFLSDMILSFTSFGDYVVLFTSFLTGQPAFLLGFLPGKKEIKFEFAVNAQPSGTASRLYRGFISYKKTWFWIIPVQVTLTNKNYYANPSTLPYDYYPGGQITDGVNLQSSSVTNWLIKYNITASHIQTFSFLPVPSALDIGSGNVSLVNADYLTRYVGAAPPLAPRNTPFQNFITAFNVNSTVNNEQHIDIRRRNGDWVADEINGIHPAANCSFVCSNNNVTVTGPSTLCNTPLVYVLNNPPAGTTKTWGATPAGIVNIAPSPDGNQATVTRISTGYFTLQVNISSAICGSLIVNSSSIRAGGFGSSDYPVSGSSSACRNTYVYFSTNTLPGATNYVWFWPGNWTYSSGQGTPNLNLITGTTSGTVGVRVANACDAGGSPGMKFVQVNNCGFSFTASPNPSTDNVTVTTAQPEGGSEAIANQTRIYQIKIIDQSGNIKKQYNYSTGVTTVNIGLSNLIAGIYTIQAYNGTVWSSQQIIKQ